MGKVDEGKALGYRDLIIVSGRLTRIALRRQSCAACSTTDDTIHRVLRSRYHVKDVSYTRSVPWITSGRPLETPIFSPSEAWSAHHGRGHILIDVVSTHPNLRGGSGRCLPARPLLSLASNHPTTQSNGGLSRAADSFGILGAIAPLGIG